MLVADSNAINDVLLARGWETLDADFLFRTGTGMAEGPVNKD